MIRALETLERQLQALMADRPITELRQDDAMAATVAKLAGNAGGRGRGAPPRSALEQAVRSYWASEEIQDFRALYLLSHGLTIPHRPEGPCILEEARRFSRVLSELNAYQGNPKAFRRCYGGLMRCYFEYDPKGSKTPQEGAQNWERLRSYLSDRNARILTGSLDPTWAVTAQAHRKVFGPRPCADYAGLVLDGRGSEVTELLQSLGVPGESWFQRELILEQVRVATKRSHSGFQAVVPALIELLRGNQVLRNEGLGLILDRYAEIDGTPIEPSLKAFSVEAWGNPWLSSGQVYWSGVTPAARAMVSDWLKLEFIETFFTLLAQDGHADSRRVDFWKRYVKAIDDIQFALADHAYGSRDRNMVIMKQKMKGLICRMDSSVRDQNAFIMSMGNLVVVEFSQISNALYGYDRRRALPFDVARPLLLEVGARNSLKHRGGVEALWLTHAEGSGHWEDKFESELRRFGIRPGAVATRNQAERAPTAAQRTSESNPPTEAQIVPDTITEFDQEWFEILVRNKALRIDDRRPKQGNFWVLTDDRDVAVKDGLSRLGFRYKAGKGWYFPEA